MTIKVISLWQPWASLWLSDDKVHETRHWYTSHRGSLAVHAAKKIVRRRDVTEALDEICVARFGSKWPESLPRGGVIGVVELVNVYSTWCGGMQAIASVNDLACGDWSPGRYAWRRGDLYRRLPAIIPLVGRQSMFKAELAI